MQPGEDLWELQPLDATRGGVPLEVEPEAVVAGGSEGAEGAEGEGLPEGGRMAREKMEGFMQTQLT